MFFQSSIETKATCITPSHYFSFLWLFQVIWPFSLQNAWSGHGVEGDQGCHQNCRWSLGSQQCEPFPFCPRWGPGQRWEAQWESPSDTFLSPHLLGRPGLSVHSCDNFRIRMKNSKELRFILSAFSFGFYLCISALKVSVDISSSSLILSLAVSSLFVSPSKTFLISITVFLF